MSRKILIVDDDLESLKLVGLMLQRRGYEIIAAHDGSQALVKAETDNPDLVILDIMMPGMDGYEVCQKLRSDSNTAYLPVIMFTAKTLVGDKVAGFQAGADDYLTKPIHPTELVSHVEALLHRAEQARVEIGAEPLPKARTIGVMGAKGGVGASTLAVNLAVALGQLDEQDEARRVSIADMRVGQGSVALLLGQTPQSGWKALMEYSLSDLDQETVDKHTMPHASGIHYLPASLQLENERQALPAELVEIVLKHLTAADYVLLDLGSVLDKATRQAIGHCDIVIIVIESEPLCLALARALIDRINALDRPPSDLRIVSIERFEAKGVYTKTEIEELLGHELTGVIKPAAEIAYQAAKQGTPIVLLQPQSEIARQLRELSQTLLV